MRDNFSALTVPKTELTPDFQAFLERVGHKKNWDSRQKGEKNKVISADWI
jgi:hypothetical protein